MTGDPIEAALRLADVLQAENAALAALDLALAASMLEEKSACASALAVAQGGVPAVRTAEARAAVARLRDLAEENRRLLERGIAVQRRVIAAIARAARARASSAPRYGARGIPAAGGAPSAFALSARV